MVARWRSAGAGMERIGSCRISRAALLSGSPTDSKLTDYVLFGHTDTVAQKDVTVVAGLTGAKRFGAGFQVNNFSLGIGDRYANMAGAAAALVAVDAP